MKKILLLFLALTAGFLPLAAQDWAPFKMGRTPYFQAGDSIYSLRLTGVQVVGSDSVFEFNPRVMPTGNFPVLTGCDGMDVMVRAKPAQDNLFGYQMLKSAAGDYTFIFTSGDTFYLKPNAALNETWQFYNAQPQPVTGTMQSKTSGLVHGMADSIVTINLSTGSQIRIGQQYGLISARSFYSYLSSTSLSQSLDLARLPEAGLGQAINHPYKIYDYQPGDKFLHYGFSTNNSGATCTETWSSSEILARNESQANDSIWFDVRVQSLVKVNGTPNAPPQFYCSQTSQLTLSQFDTVVITINPAESGYLTEWGHLNNLSHEYAPLATDTDFDASYSTGKFLSDYENRMATSFRSAPFDSCAAAYYGVIDGGLQGRTYVEGLGLVRSWNKSSWGAESEETLIAYIKGNEIYGNWQPLVLSAEEELKENPLQVYPNPFTTELTIRLPQPTSADITTYNLQGQRMSVLQTKNEANLQLHDLPSGLYLLHVQQGEKSYTQKVQKQ